jgi:hypothetical protein
MFEAALQYAIPFLTRLSQLNNSQAVFAVGVLPEPLTLLLNKMVMKYHTSYRYNSNESVQLLTRKEAEVQCFTCIT